METFPTHRLLKRLFLNKDDQDRSIKLAFFVEWPRSRLCLKEQDYKFK